MALDIPPIDTRSHAKLVAETEALVEARTPWRRSPSGSLDAVGALVRVFARMAGHAVEALNRAPDVAHLAFLELVGVRPEPPQVARAPLTFVLAEGATAASVPARTRVAAADDDSVVFETEVPLIVTASRLAHAFARDPDADAWSDLTDLCDPTRSGPRKLLTGERPIGHAMHIGCGPVLALPGLAEVVLDLDFAASLADPDDLRALPLVWSTWDGAAWCTTTPTITASSLGDRHRLHLVWAPAPPILPTDVAGKRDLWLRAELVSAEFPRWWRDRVVHGQGPQRTSAEMLATIPRVLAVSVLGRMATRRPRRVVADRGELDPSRDLLPFGEQPRFGDAFHIDPGDLRGLPDRAVIAIAVVTCQTRPGSCTPTPDLRLAWEVHTATGWREVGVSSPESNPPASGAGFTDGTRALSVDGTVRFTLPAPLVPAAEPRGVCLRARIIAGDYTQPAREDASQTPARTIASTLGPPILRGLTITFAPDGVNSPATALVTVDDHVAVDRTTDLNVRPVALAVRSPDTAPALYLGFSRSLAQVPMSTYFGTCPLDPEHAEGPSPPAPRLAWEYRTAAGWRPLVVDDETRDFTAAGLVRWSVPPDHTPSREAGRDGWWIRVRRDAGAHRGPLRASLILPYTVWARHATAVRETLGEGDGTAALILRTRQTPVLAERLEICERTELGPTEAAALAADLGPDASARDDGPFGWSLWVRWREVPDLRGSRPGDRHYLLDRARGELRLGDGVRGRAVPRIPANIHITYEVGGGAVGNRPARGLSDLKSSLAAISGVTNWTDAAGGADTEDFGDMVDRGAASLRHQGRAVAVRDFEDLARGAAPDIARVLAIPPRVDPITAAIEFDGPPPSVTRARLPVARAVDELDAPSPPTPRVRLDVVPAAAANASARAGLVRVVVVARGREPRPAPSASLLDRVATHLRAHCPSGMGVEVTGPRWVEVRVECGLVAASHANAVGLVAAARTALDAFLHPLTGGLHGLGWPFGRIPRRSDVNRALATVPGVDHLHHLELHYDPQLPSPADDLSSDEMATLAQIMISPGAHDLTLVGVAGEVP